MQLAHVLDYAYNLKIWKMRVCCKYYLDKYRVHTLIFMKILQNIFYILYKTHLMWNSP